ncbi:CCA tRNA nucleotidyltransferase [Brotaphodocola sp.]|uniref:CCA tRNA nucleotidyltransferase n=1 Tax=Brotaphodocola sp. TaxID=3073577 RepID=UPI003D7DA2EC
MVTKTAMKIPGNVERIIRTLNDHGYEAYAVGGCVRDTLLDRKPGDWDITTSARPQEVKELFHRTIDTGIQHGTVTVMMDRTGYEVTTYRIDGEYEDGRHPKQVEFTSSLIEDLKRRDFTINAMAYSHETGIVDEFGGVEDLKAKTIRCVGDPMERFTEDALRILRAIRFSAQLDFSIEEQTWNAIRVIAPNIAKVSKERIQVELTKLLLSDHPEKIREVYETGISPYISENFDSLNWKMAEIPITLPSEKYVRWAGFLRCANAYDADGTLMPQPIPSLTEVPESARRAVKILRDLKLDNDTIGRVKTLVSWSGVELPETPEAVRRAMSRMEAEVWDVLMELNGYSEKIHALTEEIRTAGDCLDLKHLAVKGQDLIKAGVQPGKALGATLNQMLDDVLSHPEHNEKEYLLSHFVK